MKWRVMGGVGSFDLVNNKIPVQARSLREKCGWSLDLADGSIPVPSSLWSLNLCFLIWKRETPLIYVPCSGVTEVNSLWGFLAAL